VNRNNAILLEKDILKDLPLALSYEWLETNGIGGYASDTALCCHTRKYHGLLVSFLPQYGERYVLLSDINEFVKQDKIQYNLSTSRYGNGVYSDGYRYIELFSCDGHPETIYRIDNLVIRKSILLVHGEDSVLIKYDYINGNSKIIIGLIPLLAYRNAHSLQKENMSIHSRVYEDNGVYMIDPYPKMPPIYFQSSEGGEFYPSPDWYKNYEFREEQKRGYDYNEDLFSPGVFEIELSPGKSFILKASLKKEKGNLPDHWKGELQLRENQKKITRLNSDDAMENLKTSGANFIISDKSGTSSIIAGFPWFGEWGRDTMISLPGLCLYCGREETALEILKTYANYEKGGLIPNQLGKGKNPSYNSIDASLWFFRALQEYIEYTGKRNEIISNFGRVIKNILLSYSTGKIEHGGMHSNGLLYVGNEKTQLTWMDAMVNGKPVSPRYGYPVEINALWYNAVRFSMELIPEEFKNGELTQLYSMIENIRLEFVKCFWLEKEKYLADVVNEKGTDTSIRPNQIFAVSLPYSPLSEEQQKYVTDRVEKDLLTPIGIRTLSPEDSEYRGTYSGKQEKRDGAYHQGTVWPWLTGNFTEAFIRVNKNNPDRSRDLFNYLKPVFFDHQKRYGLFSISEIFDGDPPHEARGCPFQAWSVGEVIRAYELLKKEIVN